MDEDLPSSVDIIVLGTGMPESILAAAAARSEKSVLHLDKNDYYGGNWNSFNFDQLQHWVANSVHQEEYQDKLENALKYDELKRDGEKMILFTKKRNLVSNVKVYEFVPQSIFEEIAPQLSDLALNQVNVSDSCVNEISSPYHDRKDDEPVCALKDEQVDNTENGNTKSSSNVVADCHENAMQIKDLPVAVTEPMKKVWSIDELCRQRRKFNIDLTPKLMFAKGPLVQLLIQSNISRYAEFKCSSQILTLLDGKLMCVPCSRADVFSTKHVSVVEKRMLMKLLEFCLDFENHPEEYRDYEAKPFSEFLKAKKLTSNIEHYLLHSIAMVEPTYATLDSLKKVQLFLQSLGRYGNSPFLFPIYGSGEMPQCFCRLCAVFGGVYCLKNSVEAIILNSNNECTAAVANEKRIACNAIAMNWTYAPEEFCAVTKVSKCISKAVFITDKSIYPTENDQLTFLRLPKGPLCPQAVTVLELGPGSNVCPEDLRLVHMSCQSLGENAEADLLPMAELLFNLPAKDGVSKPNVLWAMYYNMEDSSTLCSVTLPKNVFLLPGPDIEQDYQVAIDAAREVFFQLYPSEEFLPRAPEPEEIIMDSDPVERSSESNHAVAGDTESSAAESGDITGALDDKQDCNTGPVQSEQPTESKCDDDKHNQQ